VTKILKKLFFKKKLNKNFARKKFFEQFFCAEKNLKNVFAAQEKKILEKKIKKKSENFCGKNF